jgi:hypothetical protein
MNIRKKLVIWLLAIANPIVCWSLAYLLWKETEPEKYKTANLASIVVIIVFGIFFAVQVFKQAALL